MEQHVIPPLVCSRPHCCSSCCLRLHPHCYSWPLLLPPPQPQPQAHARDRLPRIAPQLQPAQEKRSLIFAVCHVRLASKPVCTHLSDLFRSANNQWQANSYSRGHSLVDPEAPSPLAAVARSYRKGSCAASGNGTHAQLLVLSRHSPESTFDVSYQFSSYLSTQPVKTMQRR